MSRIIEEFSAQIIPEIESEMQRGLEIIAREHSQSLYDMLAYHLGWDEGNPGRKTSGKRIRPLILLLVCEASGGDWRSALPAAAAIELMHNFSLIHDDIEDNDRLRHGRPTLWTKWGVPLALNAGDSMFALANLAMHRMKNSVPADILLEATFRFQKTTLRLTEGQHLDISYEEMQNLDISDYWPMVSGKTAALIAASSELGALLAGADPDIQEIYRKYGEKLGLAFQTLDDFLGVWGDPQITGKSSASDLLEGKKNLPVLYGLSRRGEFARRWKSGLPSPADVAGLADLLEAEGARTFTLETSARLTDEALAALSEAKPHGDAGQALFELTKNLLHRNQ